MPSPTEFLTLRGRANAAVALLVATVIVSLLSIMAERDIQSLIGDTLAGQPIGFAEVQAADDRVGLYAIVALAVLVATGIAFIAWFYRAYVNIEHLGASELRMGKGWTIGAWFVPILNLVRPKQLMNDIWRASDPARTAGDRTDWKSAPVAGLIHWWWGLLLVSGFVANVGAREVDAAGSLSERRSAGQWEMYGEYMTIVAAILAILVVRAVTSRQEVRAAVIGATATQVAYEPAQPLALENPSSVPPPAFGA
jgi:hypothetical protein